MKGLPFVRPTLYSVLGALSLSLPLILVGCGGGGAPAPPPIAPPPPPPLPSTTLAPSVVQQQVKSADLQSTLQASGVKAEEAVQTLRPNEEKTVMVQPAESAVAEGAPQSVTIKLPAGTVSVETRLAVVPKKAQDLLLNIAKASVEEQLGTAVSALAGFDIAAVVDNNADSTKPVDLRPGLEVNVTLPPTVQVPAGQKVIAVTFDPNTGKMEQVPAEVAVQTVAGRTVVTLRVLAGGRAASGRFELVTGAPPVITQIVPDQGRQGQTLIVEIQGQNLGSDVSARTVSNEPDITITQRPVPPPDAPKRIQAQFVIAPNARLGPHNVFVVTAFGATQRTFTVIAAPHPQGGALSPP